MSGWTNKSAILSIIEREKTRLHQSWYIKMDEHIQKNHKQMSDAQRSIHKKKWHSIRQHTSFLRVSEKRHIDRCIALTAIHCHTHVNCLTAVTASHISILVSICQTHSDHFTKIISWHIQIDPFTKHLQGTCKRFIKMTARHISIIWFEKCQTDVDRIMLANVRTCPSFNQKNCHKQNDLSLKWLPGTYQCHLTWAGARKLLVLCTKIVFLMYKENLLTIPFESSDSTWRWSSHIFTTILISWLMGKQQAS